MHVNEPKCFFFHKLLDLAGLVISFYGNQVVLFLSQFKVKSVLHFYCLFEHHCMNGPYASLAAMFSNRVRHLDCVINRGC